MKTLSHLFFHSHTSLLWPMWPNVIQIQRSPLPFLKNTSFRMLMQWHALQRCKAVTETSDWTFVRHFYLKCVWAAGGWWCQVTRWIKWGASAGWLFNKITLTFKLSCNSNHLSSECHRALSFLSYTSVLNVSKWLKLISCVIFHWLASTESHRSILCLHHTLLVHLMLAIH